MEKEKRGIKATTVSPFQSPRPHIFLRPEANPLPGAVLETDVTVAALVGLCFFCERPSLRPTSPRPSGRRGASSHDPEERVDIVAFDGVSAGGDHLVLGLSH